MQALWDFLGDISTTMEAFAVGLAALAGVVVVAVGLRMCWIAFKDLKPKPTTTPPTPTAEINGVNTALTETQTTTEGAVTIPIGDVTKVLAELAKSAAGVAIAVLLLGTVLLVGASFAPSEDDDAGASPTPASGPTASP